MTATQLLAALRAETGRRKYFIRLEILEQTTNLVKARLSISPDLFVQIYCNDRFDTLSLALIRNRQHIYARDQLGGRWHRHLPTDPDKHDVSPEGSKAVTLSEFLDEAEKVLAELSLP